MTRVTIGASVTVLASALTIVLAQGQPPPGGAQTAPAAAPGGAAQGRGAAGGRGAPPAEPDFTKKPPIQPLTPAEEAKKFWLPPGFKMEAVLADPDIEEPGQIAFDGNGRMFVLELRGYMQDADGSGTLDPVGRVSVHEDRNNDGVYETHHVYVDKLVFPRFVMPWGTDAILTKESNADEVWKYTDVNGDLVADKRELFATGLGRLLNVEHQEAGFFWALDNWIYSTINPVRLRWTPNGVIREPTGSNGAQWGVSQDNYGKPWFQAGASGMPGYFQLHVAYGNFTNPQQFEPDLNITWGAPVLIADMQGGMNSVRWPDGSLARATGSGGNDVYRGDRLPKDMIGDLFYGEVVARIVRRLHPVKAEGLTQLRNVYPLSEFLKSTDPLFRPVDVTTAPDGTMYITDMYRGIIQESQWSGPGTYLRQRIDQYSLDKVVRHGRVWRLSYEGMGRRTEAPRMLDETPAQLVGHLNDPNGWWRDTAQQQLVLRQDKSVVPALKLMAMSPGDQLGRIHALWTLDGLMAAAAASLRQLMEDADPQIRLQAIRASETLYKAGDKSLAGDYKRLTKDADADVVMQAMMTMNTLKVVDAKLAIQAVLETNKARGPQLVSNTILNPPAAATGIGSGLMEAIAPYTPEEQKVLEKGKDIYASLCFTCHGDDGRGTAAPGGAAGATLGPALAASPRVLGHREYIVKALLHGLTGPINGTTYAEVMVAMGQAPDDWVAAIGSYVRNAFGNRAPLVRPEDVKRIRAATTARKKSWTVAELEASLPKLLVADPAWKLSASHNSAFVANALTIQPWTSGEPQKPGMWFQIELPQPVSLSELHFESAAVAPENLPTKPGAPPRTAIGGGGRGRAAGPGAPAGPPAATPAPPPPRPGYPRGFKVETSLDGTRWTLAAQGQGSGVTTDIAFAPVRAKFVRITQTAAIADAPLWSIQRLKLYETGK